MNIQSLLKDKNNFVYPVKGISMLPLLSPHRDMVKLSHHNNQFHEMDVILYKRRHGVYVLHRLIRKKNNKWFVVGDNCKEGEWIREDKIVAVAEGFIQNGVYISCKNEKYISYVHSLEMNLSQRRIMVLEEMPHYVAAFSTLIILLKDSLCRTITEVTNSPDWSLVINLAKKHKICGLVARRIECEENCPEYIKHEFQQLFLHAKKRKVLFMEERKRIFSLFEQENISFIPLKGIILDNYYPNNCIREFADQDILVCEKDIAKVKQILQNNCYTVKTGSVHDAYYKEPIYNFEIHKKLFTPDKDYSQLFENVWDNCALFNGKQCEYHMNVEDFYLHNLAHFKKHYESAGAGLRSFADMYVLNQILPTRDNVVKRISCCSLLDFYYKIQTILQTIFEGKPENIPMDDLIYIQLCGVYGNLTNTIDNCLEKEEKKHYLLKRIFQPYNVIRESYRILYYLPFLLPLCWVLRFFRLVDKKRRKQALIEYKYVKER